MVKIAPSILSADFSKLGEEILALDLAGADWIHFDVMDGQFVPNISFGYKILGDIKHLTLIPFDVHLMVYEPFAYLEEFAKKGANYITIHVEACEDPNKYFTKCRELGVKPGITLSPDTPVEAIIPYLKEVDLVLVMSVYPGFGGQSFIPSSLDKLRELDRLREINGYSYLLEVDGGVDPSNAPVLRSTGVDVLVAGSAVFGSSDYKKTIEELRG